MAHPGDAVIGTNPGSGLDTEQRRAGRRDALALDQADARTRAHSARRPGFGSTRVGADSDDDDDGGVFSPFARAPQPSVSLSATRRHAREQMFEDAYRHRLVRIRDWPGSLGDLEDATDDSGYDPQEAIGSVDQKVHGPGWGAGPFGSTTSEKRQVRHISAMMEDIALSEEMEPTRMSREAYHEHLVDRADRPLSKKEIALFEALEAAEGEQIEATRAQLDAAWKPRPTRPFVYDEETNWPIDDPFSRFYAFKEVTPAEPGPDPKYKETPMRDGKYAAGDAAVATFPRSSGSTTGRQFVMRHKTERMWEEQEPIRREISQRAWVRFIERFEKMQTARRDAAFAKAVKEAAAQGQRAPAPVRVPAIPARSKPTGGKGPWLQKWRKTMSTPRPNSPDHLSKEEEDLLRMTNPARFAIIEDLHAQIAAWDEANAEVNRFNTEAAASEAKAYAEWLRSENDRSRHWVAQDEALDFNERVAALHAELNEAVEIPTEAQRLINKEAYPWETVDADGAVVAREPQAPPDIDTIEYAIYERTHANYTLQVECVQKLLGYMTSYGRPSEKNDWYYAGPYWRTRALIHSLIQNNDTKTVKQFGYGVKLAQVDALTFFVCRNIDPKTGHVLGTMRYVRNVDGAAVHKSIAIRNIAWAVNNRLLGEMHPYVQLTAGGLDPALTLGSIDVAMLKDAQNYRSWVGKKYDVFQKVERDIRRVLFNAMFFNTGDHAADRISTAWSPELRALLGASYPNRGKAAEQWHYDTAYRAIAGGPNANEFVYKQQNAAAEERIETCVDVELLKLFYDEFCHALGPAPLSDELMYTPTGTLRVDFSVRAAVPMLAHEVYLMRLVDDLRSDPFSLPLYDAFLRPRFWHKEWLLLWTWDEIKEYYDTMHDDADVGWAVLFADHARHPELIAEIASAMLETFNETLRRHADAGEDAQGDELLRKVNQEVAAHNWLPGEAGEDEWTDVDESSRLFFFHSYVRFAFRAFPTRHVQGDGGVVYQPVMLSKVGGKSDGARPHVVRRLHEAWEVSIVDALDLPTRPTESGYKKPLTLDDLYLRAQQGYYAGPAEDAIAAMERDLTMLFDTAHAWYATRAFNVFDLDTNAVRETLSGFDYHWDEDDRHRLRINGKKFSDMVEVCRRYYLDGYDSLGKTKGANSQYRLSQKRLAGAQKGVDDAKAAAAAAKPKKRQPMRASATSAKKTVIEKEEERLQRAKVEQGLRASAARVAGSGGACSRLQIIRRLKLDDAKDKDDVDDKRSDLFVSHLYEWRKQATWQALQELAGRLPAPGAATARADGFAFTARDVQARMLEILGNYDGLPRGAVVEAPGGRTGEWTLSTQFAHALGLHQVVDAFVQCQIPRTRRDFIIEPAQLQGPGDWGLTVPTGQMSLYHGMRGVTERAVQCIMSSTVPGVEFELADGTKDFIPRDIQAGINWFKRDAQGRINDDAPRGPYDLYVPIKADDTGAAGMELDGETVDATKLERDAERNRNRLEIFRERERTDPLVPLISRLNGTLVDEATAAEAMSTWMVPKPEYFIGGENGPAWRALVEWGKAQNPPLDPVEAVTRGIRSVLPEAGIYQWRAELDTEQDREEAGSGNYGDGDVENLFGGDESADDDGDGTSTVEELADVQNMDIGDRAE